MSDSPQKNDLEMVRPQIVFYGPVAEHNMCCPVCWYESAVFDIQNHLFLPCWECQESGWTLTKKRKRRKKTTK